LATKANYKVLAGKPQVTVSKYMRSVAVSGNLGSIMLKDAAGHDVEYEAVQAHLTAGAMHSTGDSVPDAELLVVHKPKGAHDGLTESVIVSMLFRQDGTGSSDLFTQLGFPAAAGMEEPEMATWEAASSVDIRSAMDTSMQGDWYSYSGSVPVPPCTENVHYIVLKTEQPVAETQVAMLRAVLTKHTGGSLKRPAAPRAPEGVCREIQESSFIVPQPAPSCTAEGTSQTAACWQTTCGKSPVDIEPAKADRSLGMLKASDLVRYAPTGHATVAPSAHSLDVTGHFGHLMLNGRVFEAKKMSIKAISQHTFNGTRFAGELVIEHTLFGDGAVGHSGGDHSSDGHRRLSEETHGQASDGHGHGLHQVMLSVPLRLGRENALLRELGLGVEANNLAIRHGNSYDIDTEVDLAAALAPSTSQQWYWYSGGLTTPGSSCPAWGVKWMVFEIPLEVSLAQLNALALPVSGLDSTMAPRPVDEASIVASNLPAQGLGLGSSTCSGGSAQSPIDIVSSAVSKVGSDSFLAKASWKPISGLRLENTGNTLGFVSNQMGYATIIGPNGFPKFYQVTSVALRMPSEHLIDGKQYPAELQITHKNQKTVLELEDDDALITSVMFEFGEESKLLKQMLPAGLPHAGHHVTLETPVDLQWALGPAIDGPFFKYDGSYTTDGCAEAVKWAVFETPMTLSTAQWQAFKAAFPNPGNNRAVQPLGGRSIVKNTLEEADAIDYKFFLNREMGRDKQTTEPLYILFPIIGTVLLCSTIMTAVFQREDPKRKATSAGGIVEATTYGRGGYNEL